MSSQPPDQHSAAAAAAAGDGGDQLILAGRSFSESEPEVGMAVIRLSDAKELDEAVVACLDEKADAEYVKYLKRREPKLIPIYPKVVN